MYATIIDYNGKELRSSFFTNERKAIEYAKSMAGVIAVEKIGEGLIWKRYLQK